MGNLVIGGGNITPGQGLDFGRVIVPGGAAMTRTFNLTNIGQQAMRVQPRFVKGGQGFSITAPAAFPAMLAVGARLPITVRFASAMVGMLTDAVTFTDANFAGTSLSGEGVAPAPPQGDGEPPGGG